MNSSTNKVPDPAEDTLRERLAAYAHEAWSRDMEGMLIYSGRVPETSDRLLPEDLVVKWKQMMGTQYADLPETEKLPNRTEAGLILAILHEHPESKDGKFWPPGVMETGPVLKAQKFVDATISLSGKHKKETEAMSEEAEDESGFLECWTFVSKTATIILCVLLALYCVVRGEYLGVKLRGLEAASEAWATKADLTELRDTDIALARMDGKMMGYLQAQQNALGDHAKLLNKYLAPKAAMERQANARRTSGVMRAELKKREAPEKAGRSWLRRVSGWNWLTKKD